MGRQNRGSRRGTWSAYAAQFRAIRVWCHSGGLHHRPGSIGPAGIEEVPHLTAAAKIQRGGYPPKRPKPRQTLAPASPAKPPALLELRFVLDQALQRGDKLRQCGYR